MDGEPLHDGDVVNPLAYGISTRLCPAHRQSQIRQQADRTVGDGWPVYAIMFFACGCQVVALKNPFTGAVFRKLYFTSPDSATTCLHNHFCTVVDSVADASRRFYQKVRGAPIHEQVSIRRLIDLTAE